MNENGHTVVRRFSADLGLFVSVCKVVGNMEFDVWREALLIR